MKKGALFLNHTIMGGAEKSALEQLSFFSDKSMDVFYPKVTNDEESLDDEFKVSSVDSISTFSFPKAFNKLSRGGGNNYLLGAASYFLAVFKILKLPLKDYRFLWLNGLKVFIFLCPVLCLINYKGKVFFHLRDYLNPNIFIKTCVKLCRFFNVNLEYIANSKSVKKHFVKGFGVIESSVHVCYNICEMDPFGDKQKVGKTIGLCSMLTPWKGIHTIILFSSLYKEELRKMGVDKILVFGDAIYSTKGEHSDYHLQLKQMCKKLNNDLVEFKGRRPSKEIYQSIDLLIHSSVEPEPFGRIIMEGFGAKIPVLSTGIGGSSEIFENLHECCFEKYDYEGLLSKISVLFSDSIIYNDIIEKQTARYNEINKLARSSLADVFQV